MADTYVERMKYRTNGLPAGYPLHRRQDVILGDGGNAGKIVQLGELAVAHDGRPSLLAAIVRCLLKLLGRVSLALAREAAFDVRKELALVLLERQHIVATLVQYRLGEGTAAKKRVRRDDLAFQPQHLEDFQSRLEPFLPGAFREASATRALAAKTLTK